MPDNTLAQYLNKEYKDIISELHVVQRTSKEGNPYCAIEMCFINGFKKLLFLRSDEQFAWTNAFDLVDSDQIASL